MSILRPNLRMAAAALSVLFVMAVPASAHFTMEQVLNYPYVGQSRIDRAWRSRRLGAQCRRRAQCVGGRRSRFKARQVTRYKNDDGQEITQLTFSPDGSHLVYVRGGDHDANWPAEGDIAPDPDIVTPISRRSRSGAPRWTARPMKVAEGDEPAISASGQTRLCREGHQVWTAPLDGERANPNVAVLRSRQGSRICSWSPDGKRLAFSSGRGDHAFIGVFTDKDQAAALSRAVDQSGFLAALVAGRKAHRLCARAGRRRRARFRS